MPRFLERDEAEREPPCEPYPWDGVRNVRRSSSNRRLAAWAARAGPQGRAGTRRVGIGRTSRRGPERHCGGARGSAFARTSARGRGPTRRPGGGARLTSGAAADRPAPGAAAEGQGLAKEIDRRAVRGRDVAARRRRSSCTWGRGRGGARVRPRRRGRGARGAGAGYASPRAARVAGAGARDRQGVVGLHPGGKRLEPPSEWNETSTPGHGRDRLGRGRVRGTAQKRRWWGRQAWHPDPDGHERRPGGGAMPRRAQRTALRLDPRRAEW